MSFDDQIMSKTAIYLANITLPSRLQHPLIFFAAFRVMFLMPQVCFKPITYIEMHHVRTFCSVWRHGFFVLRDVHSQHVYLQEESLPPFLSCQIHLNSHSEFVLIIFYLQLINSSHADSSMADKKHGKIMMIIIMYIQLKI